MKALVYCNPGCLEYRDVPLPHVRGEDTVVRVDSVGICGSDMHAYLGHDERRPPPLILGHEAAGLTEEGTRVTINPLVTCGHCRHCLEGRENLCLYREILSMMPREGAFAQYLSIPKDNMITVPNHVAMEKAALTEPLACGWHAVSLANNLTRDGIKDKTCLVIGGGAIGLGVALILQARGAGKVYIVENNPIRHPMLLQAGNFHVCTSDDFEKASKEKTEEVHLIFDAVGSTQTRQFACRFIAVGGGLIHIGLAGGVDGIDTRRLTLQEIFFVGSYTYTPSDFKETAHAIFDGRLGNLDWLEIRALQDGSQAFSDIQNGLVKAAKIILKV